MQGQRLAHYEVQSRLGRGGMGEVWKAWDSRLERTVAIKILSAPSDAAVAGTLAEARTASKLNHLNICTVYEVGTDAGRSFIVMELVEGRPISELIPSDGLSADTVIRYGIQIAEALEHAHESGVVHRDLGELASRRIGRADPIRTLRRGGSPDANPNRPEAASRTVARS